MLKLKGLWGVECILAVIGAGGPVKQSNIITYVEACSRSPSSTAGLAAGTSSCCLPAPHTCAERKN
eukprot:717887-Prorocentrum_minimum.AAC.1